MWVDILLGLNNIKYVAVGEVWKGVTPTPPHPPPSIDI